MSGIRPGAPGATRTCPHCKAEILESASVCPACRHHVRFDLATVRGAPQPSVTAFKVEGTIRNSEAEEPWEYSVVLTIRNSRGEEVNRQVVGVGALHAADERTFSLSVEVFKPADQKVPAGG